MIQIEAEQWQRAWDDFRAKVAPTWQAIQRICEAFYGADDAEYIRQRQRITAAKQRARIVTRANALRRSTRRRKSDRRARTAVPTHTASESPRESQRRH